MPTTGGASTLPGARAVARFVRVSPMKARRVVNLIRGLPAQEAQTVLQFAPQAASEQVYKVLASAMANAENNESLDKESLLVSEAYVDEGPTFKRFRPRAQGRAYRIRKRTSHITIVVESVQAAAPSRKPGRPKATRPKAAADTATSDAAVAEGAAETPDAPAAETATTSPAATSGQAAKSGKLVPAAKSGKKATGADSGEKESAE